MATVAITSLTAASALDGTELLALEQAGAARKLTTGELINNVARVADATGTDSAADTAAINAAFVAAGAGGVVQFPSNQVYLTEGLPGATGNLPRLVYGNGCTLKLRDEALGTVTGGPYDTTGGTLTTFEVADATVFKQGDRIVIWNGTNITNAASVSSASGTTIVTSNPITFDAGSLTFTATATVTTDDRCLYTAVTSADNAMEITGLTFDGNSSNRGTNRHFENSMLLSVLGDDTGTYLPPIWVHHCRFINAPCDSFSANSVPHLKVSDNHFENGFGAGFHPGGSVASINMVCANNTFYNIYQATDITTPTVIEFGHVTGHGAMVTSLGPLRYVVSGNVVDGTKGFGFDGVNNSSNTDVSLVGNVFNNCLHGAFRQETDDGQRFSVVGNIIKDCGHDLTTATGSLETTQIRNLAQADTVVSGNVFENSVLNVLLDAGGMVISGNTFNNISKVKGTNEIACLSINYSSSQPHDLAVTGNMFRLPKTTAELAALSEENESLDCLYMNKARNVMLQGNNFVGGRFGILIINTTDNLTIANNNFSDQMNNGGSNSHAIKVSGNSATTGLVITGNNISRANEDATGAWIALELDTITTAKAVSITNNTITMQGTIRPAGGGRVGIELNANTDNIYVYGNTIHMWQSSDTTISGASLTASSRVVGNFIQEGAAQSIGSAVNTWV